MHMARHRRPWTDEEDELLRLAVLQEHPDTSQPIQWLAVARHVPGRNNKDCRKRWCTKMYTAVAKGGWSVEEDTLLIQAVEKYGTKWSLVASMVGTRKSCQCARRWSDTLNPEIDKTPWTPAEDSKLVAAVEEHGKAWAYITKTFFPGRTGLAAKNRYVALMRPSSRHISSRHHDQASTIQSPNTFIPLSMDQKERNQHGPITPDSFEFYDSEDSDSLSSRSRSASVSFQTQLFSNSKEVDEIFAGILNSQYYAPMEQITAPLLSSMVLAPPAEPIMPTPLNLWPNFSMPAPDRNLWSTMFGIAPSSEQYCRFSEV